MKPLICIFSVVSMLACVACSDEMETQIQTSALLHDAEVEVLPFEGEGNTRLAYSDKNAISWTDGDTIGVFAVTEEVNNPQVSMTYSIDYYKSNETHEFESVYLFKSGAWGFQPGQSYQAYFPIDPRKAASFQSVLFQYDSVQVVTEVNSPAANLGKYDRLASEVATPGLKGNSDTIHFVMAHKTALLALSFNLPSGAAYDSFSLYLTDATGNRIGCGFPARLSYSLQSGSFSMVDSERVSYQLQMSERISNNETNWVFYLLVPPYGVVGETLYMEYGIDAISTQHAAMPATLEAGHLYTLVFEE